MEILGFHTDTVRNVGPILTYTPHRKGKVTPLEELLRYEGLGPADMEQVFRPAALWNSARMMGCIGRRFCVTESGYLALVSPGTVEGDAVCILSGVNTPFVLRTNTANKADHCGGDGGKRSPNTSLSARLMCMESWTVRWWQQEDGAWRLLLLFESYATVHVRLLRSCTT